MIVLFGPRSGARHFLRGKVPLFDAKVVFVNSSRSELEIEAFKTLGCTIEKAPGDPDAGEGV